MRLKSFLTLAIPALMLSYSLVLGQESRKRELRAAWIATVKNIDWPSRKALGAAEQQQEFVKLLDTLKSTGMNAVIVQVRPVADAFHPSSYEPWSEYLSGSQGKPSQPYYNPLSFMITEARKRGLEFHAWFNPYRASMEPDMIYAAGHPMYKHRDWFVEYGGKYYYDPGHPDAQQFVLSSIMETVKHYDLDAVHFDDYFYPYRIADLEFPDSCSYQTYGAGAFANRDDWRRSNVDLFVRQLSKRIKAEKPHLKFGISPFGVWRNIDKDSTGSHTRAGQTNYDDLFADVLKWLREGWIDYITPQLYWHIGFELADYKVLVDWWSKHTYGRHLYIGQGVYRIGGKGWENPEELVNQIELNRTYDEIKGSMFFSAKSFLQDKNQVNGMMKKVYQHKALVPVMPWLPNEIPPAPDFHRISGSVEEGVRLEWQDSTSSAASCYIIYRFSGKDSLDMENAAHILGVVPRQPYRKQSWVDRGTNKRHEYTYIVTAADRLHNESTGGQPVRVKTRGKRRELRILKVAE
jgi:uncharacterized lipoprotein YddW (UPF0748 family)